MTPEVQERIAQLRRGEIPDGYRKTTLGIVPVSWNSQRVDELCTITSGSTPKRNNPDYFTGDILWVTSGELKSKYIFDTKEKITDSAAKDSGLALYEPGTVVIAIYGLEAAGVRGTASIIARKSTISQACMAFTQFQNVDNEFFYYWYLNHGEMIGLRYAQGTKQQNLSVDIVGAFPVCFPEFHEQQKIAAILSTQDKVIELKERLLTEKRRQKKYLMQRLLTGKQRLPRFSGKWVKVKLKSLAKKILRKNVDFSVNLVFSNSAQHGMIPQEEQFDKSIANKEHINGYYIVNPGDFVYNSRISVTAPCGPINVNESGKIGIVSPLYTVFSVNSSIAQNEYLKHYFKSTCWFQYVKSIANYGVRHDRMNISDDDFFAMPLLIPPLDEQTAIADILSAADREIDLLRASLEQEKRKKKALSQLLLTGIVRCISNE